MPSGVYIRGATPAERLWEKVDIKGENECWNWNGITDGDGYGMIFYDGNNKRCHSLSYVLKYGKLPKGTEVNHICNNPKCVNPNHLKADTHANNVRYAFQCGRIKRPKGEEHPSHKFTWDLVKKIRKEYTETLISQNELAEKYNVCLRSIYLLLNNKTWIDTEYKKPIKSRSAGEHNSHTKLTWAQVNEIRDGKKQGKYNKNGGDHTTKKGITLDQLADKYKVSKSTIDCIIANKTWVVKK